MGKLAARGSAIALFARTDRKVTASAINACVLDLLGLPLRTYIVVAILNEERYSLALDIVSLRGGLQPISSCGYVLDELVVAERSTGVRMYDCSRGWIMLD